MEDQDRMYRLPWKETDNPNGWIEPTTRCQLRCPGCYRGCGAAEGCDRSFEELTGDIKELIHRRNIQTLTIAGGEPLLYGKLDELIAYARNLGLDVVVATNGESLDTARLQRLSAAGATRVMIHIQTGQGRADGDFPGAVEARREQFCEMFRNAGGTTLGFFFAVNTGNITEMMRLIEQTKRNPDVIRMVLFMMQQDLLTGRESGRPDWAELKQRVEEAYGMEFAAFLGRTRQGGVSWLLGGIVYAGRRILGSIDGAVFRRVQEERRRSEGRYVHTSNRTWKENGTGLSFCAGNASIRRLTWNWAKSGFRRPLRHQVIMLLRTPEKPAHMWDYCEGCPDMMLHEGHLVPSCLLEAARLGQLQLSGKREA